MVLRSLLYRANHARKESPKRVMRATTKVTLQVFFGGRQLFCSWRAVYSFQEPYVRFVFAKKVLFRLMFAISCMSCASPKLHPDERRAGLMKFGVSFVKDSRLGWGVR